MSSRSFCSCSRTNSQRVAQRGDGRLQRRLHVAPLELEPVDFPLDLLEPALALLEDQLGARLGILDDATGFLLGVLADLVGEALRGQQRVAEIPLVLAVFRHHRFEPQQFLVQPVGLAERLLVVVGHLAQQGIDLVAVVAAHDDAQFGLPKVEWGHLHGRSPAGGIPGTWSFGRSAHRTSGGRPIRTAQGRRGAEDRRADPDHRGAFLDRHLEIVAHAHRELAEHVEPERRSPRAGRGVRAGSGSRAGRPPGRRATAAGASGRPGGRRGTGRPRSTTTLTDVERGAVLGRLAGQVHLHQDLRTTFRRRRPRGRRASRISIRSMEWMQENGTAALRALFDWRCPMRCQRTGRSGAAAIFWSASWTRFSPKSSWPAAAAARTSSIECVFDTATRRTSSGSAARARCGARDPLANLREAPGEVGFAHRSAGTASRERTRSPAAFSRGRPRRTADWQLTAAYFFNCVSMAFTWAAY